MQMGFPFMRLYNAFRYEPGVIFSMRQNDSYSSAFVSQLGYVIYRRVLRYYSGEEDGLGEYSVFGLSILKSLPLSLCCFSHLQCCVLFSDMRKALSRDVGKKSIIPLKRPVTPDELEYD
jgi:N-terminal acetyltransferase B complex catalytic subunit